MITYKNIDSLEMAQELRLLRNDCAEWMTNDTSYISPERQEKFYREKIETKDIPAWLMYSDERVVAYGMLTFSADGRAWSSTGVRPTERRQGFGKLITIETVRRAHDLGVPIWADVRRDNAGQQKICYDIGYRWVDSYEKNCLLIDVMICEELLP